MRILLVDDSPKHRKHGAQDLTALGHEVVALSDYTVAQHVAKDGDFDVALLDLLMPAEATTLGGEGMAFFGQPFPIGFPLAISMALAGVKLIAVATDTNHHHHPASAVVDWFGERRPVTIEGSRVLFIHAPLYVDGTKHWARVLELLTA